MPTVQERSAAQEIEDVQRALDQARRRFPPTPEVERYEWALYLDSTGEDAVRITVVLKDPPGRDLYDWTELAPIRDAVVDTFREQGIHRWPYVGFNLKSEIEAPDEQDSQEFPEDDDDDDDEEREPRSANG